MLTQNKDSDLLTSALCSVGMHSEKQVLDWVRSRSNMNQYSVRIVPLDQLRGWELDSNTGNLRHSSGKFFQIEGLDIQIKTNNVQSWQQPIINQPEIGILGFVAKRINGILHLLVQAKMEPGNINFIQISPTVQATRSNYTQAHGGRRPTFMEYFLEKQVGQILVDQLQSEQGTRYLKKRNRNVIVLLPDEYHLPHSEEHMWVTVGQLQKLMRFPNLVHLDCRSILGSVTYRVSMNQHSVHSNSAQATFNARIRTSICIDDDHAEWDMPSVLSWLTGIKCQTEVTASTIPLNRVDAWGLLNGVITHESNRYFSVVGVDVTASNREVAGWCQPLIRSIDGGIIGLAAQMKGGVLHFLIQGRVEPGLIDIVELAPTVQCTPANYQEITSPHLPAFVGMFQAAALEHVRFDSMLSDEGGRFYHSQQRHRVIELDEDIEVELPPNYCWMTLRQIQSFAQFSNQINIELRSILSCLVLAE